MGKARRTLRSNSSLPYNEFSQSLKVGRKHNKDRHSGMRSMGEGDDSVRESLQRLPSVDSVLTDAELAEWRGSPLATEAVREVLQEMREELGKGGGKVHGSSGVAGIAADRLRRNFASRLYRVINGTGVIIHTNLGRVPLGEKAIEAMINVARGYSTLEFDVERGRRGSRHFLVHHLLCSLTGAEDSLVTNNNAAALLLVLSTLARRREVIVSRGQLIEIGGGFRIPDICRASGAKLVEVGTTNRTRIEDYEAAIGPRTALLLRVHPSNFRIVGFTGEAGLEQLVELGEKHGLPVVDDLGSGALVDTSNRANLPSEPVVDDIIRAGASIVTFSGDKLLGGPQAGIAVGGKDLIARMRKHPLMRALRPDKLTFAALDATLRAYLAPRQLGRELPIWKMMEATVDQLADWGANILASVLPAVEAFGVSIELSASESYTGGGSLPMQSMPSLALTFRGTGRKLSSLQRALRMVRPPVIGYLKDGIFRLDLRTMMIESENEVIESILSALKGK